MSGDWDGKLIRLAQPARGCRVGQEGRVLSVDDPDLALVELLDHDGKPVRVVEVPYDTLRAA